jgi:hypothetical protein
MKFLTSLAISSFMFICLACGHGRPVDESEITGPTQPVIPANTTMQPQTIPVNLDASNSPATPVNIPTNKQVQPAATTAVAPGMNPPHGQPGHRCDIAVGAPLNSKPASNAVTPVNISSDKVAQPVTAVAPGMNPPHGQPGHRCDIAVGAPLDSKPILIAGTPSTNTVTSSQSIPSIIPIKPLPDSSKQNR